MAHAAEPAEPHASHAVEDAHAPAHVDGDDIPHHGHALAEPRSPLWLPVVGAVLLATVLVWWLSTPSDAEEAAAAAAASASASASAMASGSAPAGTIEGQPALTANNAPPRPPGMPTLPPGMQMAPGAAINPKFKQP